MKSILIYGTGSYVLGNKIIKPVILPSILNYIKFSNLNYNLVFIKNKKNKISYIVNSIEKIFREYNISLPYKIHFLKKQKNSEIISSYKDIFCSIISIPDNEHFKVTKLCLQQGIDVIVVKPLVTNVNENKILINIAKKNNCLGFVDYHKRFDKHSMLIKNFNNKQINQLYLIDISYSQKKLVATKVFNWTEKTNVLNYLGSHYIDFVYHTTGFKPSSVMAIGTKKYLINKNINTYDSIICLIKWKKGKNSFILNLKTNWIDPIKETSMSDQKVTLFYTNGKIISDQKDRGFYLSSDQNDYESINPDFNQKFNFNNNLLNDYQGYGFKSISTFLNLINLKRNNKKFKYEMYPNLEQSLIVSMVLEAASKSLRNKSKWIEIL